MPTEGIRKTGPRGQSEAGHRRGLGARVPAALGSDRIHRRYVMFKPSGQLHVPRHRRMGQCTDFLHEYSRDHATANATPQLVPPASGHAGRTRRATRRTMHPPSAREPYRAHQYRQTCTIDRNNGCLVAAGKHRCSRSDHQNNQRSREHLAPIALRSILKHQRRSPSWSD